MASRRLGLDMRIERTLKRCYPTSTRLKQVPANFGKKYPGTREYLRLFWVDTRVPV